MFNMEVDRIRVLLRTRIVMNDACVALGSDDSVRKGRLGVQTERISPAEYVGRELIWIRSAKQPDRILADEGTGCGIVIPIPVVVQPRLCIVTS